MVPDPLIDQRSTPAPLPAARAPPPTVSLTCPGGLPRPHDAHICGGPLLPPAASSSPRGTLLYILQLMSSLVRVYTSFFSFDKYVSGSAASGVQVRPTILDKSPKPNE